MNLLTQLHLHLPPWVDDEVDALRDYSDPSAKIALAIDLSRRNVRHGTGGPFGAAVFDPSGRLAGVGVNRVVPTTCSIAHAEMMAIATTQQRLQRVRLNETGGPWTLASSAQPCAMCYGALFWSGIDQLLVAARADDVQGLAGFDEGPMPADWQGELNKRGIAVQADIARNAACDVLRDYGSGGRVY